MAFPALLARPLFQRLIHTRSLGLSEGTLAFSWILSPWTLLVTGPLVLAARRVRHELRWAAAFEAGAATGAITVVLTSLLNALALTFGGIDDFRVVAALTLTMHLPLALVEGAILGSIANLLIRVKPSLLNPESHRITVQQQPIAFACEVQPAPVGYAESTRD
jgi:hypothetical protein